MEFMCLFCPAFISLYFHCKDIKISQINILKLICYYFFYVNLINLSILIITNILFKTNTYLFTVSFSIKYLLLANLLSIVYPKILRKIKKWYIFHHEKVSNNFMKFLKTKKTKNAFKTFSFIFLNTMLFSIVDFNLRYIAFNITDFYSLYGIYPYVYTISFSLLINTAILVLPRIASKIALIIINILTILLFLIHYMLLQIKSQAFTVHLLGNTNEGLSYLNFIFKEINIKLIFIILLLIIITIVNFKLLSKIKRPNKIKRVIIILVVTILFVISNFITTKKLTNYDNEAWEAIDSLGYYYDNIINYNKSLLVLGLYEYTYRDINYYFSNLKEAYGSIEEIEEIISNSNMVNDKNEYTGIFEGKNLIMIQMESIDNLMINDETMPTLTYMKENGWNFTGRYSNNVSTFYTEFTALTGLYYLGSESIINNNTYTNSIPNMFNKLGYSTQSVHENNGKYYNREILHKNIGFKNSYFLYDILDNYEMLYDPQIIEISDIYQNVISKELEPFYSYIVTISAHGPYTNNYRCNRDLESGHDEFSCLSHLSNLTDKMLEELLLKLEEDNLLENSVIVLFSDHYPYAYSFNDEELEKLEKIDSTYQIRNIPFIIYADGIESQEINTLLNDVDILPTILNLFGIEYDPNTYVGVDIFSENHRNLIYLSDYSWYDGKIYSGNLNNKDTNEYQDYYEYVTNRLKLNRMIISQNYYG